jgi:hypothetical protein
MAREEIGPVGGVGRAHRGPLHHGSSCSPCLPSSWSRAGRVAVGVVLDSHDPADSAPDGRLSALIRPGPGC